MIAIQHLEKQDNVLSPECEYFDDSEKESLLFVLRKNRLFPILLKGLWGMWAFSRVSTWMSKQ